MTPAIDRPTEVEGLLAANAARLNLNFAQGLRPPARIDVSDWAAKYRHFPEDSAYPGKYQADRAPYLAEIMDALSPHHPAAEVSIIKCAQSGGSVAGENWIGFISDVAPGPLMYVQATITAAKDWLAEKFWPMVEVSPRLNPDRNGSIMPRRVRDGSGTTALRVRFKRGGWMLIAGANSAATLRQHSVRYAVEDDLDQFPDDLDNQGSPESMVEARLTTFTRLGLSKRLKISTPTNAGASKIGRAYKRSDQRKFYLACGHCASRFDPIWADIQWPDGKPELAALTNPCCGVVSAHWEKEGMTRADGWLATVEVDGERPPRVMTEAEFQRWKARDLGGLPRGYHIKGIISAFLTWAKMATSFVEAQGNVNALRTWTNLTAGEEFVIKGDAPPSEDLETLREQDWGKGQVPHGPVVFTLGCDIQGDGIYYEALGHAERAETWELDHGFLPGPTDVIGAGAWARLEEYAERRMVLPGGKAFGFDQVMVDAGYNTEAAKAFCKRRPRRMAVFGRDGWTRPILGRGQAIDYQAARSQSRKRRKKKAGEEAHLVGTYGAKLAWFGFLRSSIEMAKAQLRGERPEPIRGRVHFSRDAGTDYFDMLTSESCVVEMKAGQPTRVWKPETGRQNHWLDCRIYNMAAAEALALDSLSEVDWAKLRTDRCAAADPNQGDLIALANQPPREAAPQAAPAPTETARSFVDAGESYL